MAARAVWPDDPADAIMAVMERAFDPAFGEAWTRRQVSDALVLGTCHHALIDAQGTVGDSPGESCAGFYLSRIAHDEQELLLFAVVPELRRRRLGARLLEHFLERARELRMARVFLEVRDDNPARALYEAHGFRSVGRRPSYYRGKDGVRRDAISYALALR